MSQRKVNRLEKSNTKEKKKKIVEKTYSLRKFPFPGYNTLNLGETPKESNGRYQCTPYNTSKRFE